MLFQHGTPVYRTWLVCTTLHTHQIAHSNDRGPLKVRGEQLYVDCGRHEHQFQAPPPFNEASQYAQQEVTMDMPLMYLGKKVC